MRLDEANKLLRSMQGKSTTNLMYMGYSIGTIKRAIRTVYSRESATRDDLRCACAIEAIIQKLKHQI